MPGIVESSSRAIGSGVANGTATGLEWLSLLAGILIVSFTALDVIRTLIMTRGSRSIIRTCFANPIAWFINLFARQSKNYLRRDSIQSWIAPMMLVGSLSAWLLLYLVGYSLMISGIEGLDISTSFREAGSSLFTLGFASGDRTQLSIIDFIAAATGPITIGLMISYLPSLYSSYNRRELDVAILKARAGEPNWGPEILARHATLDSDRAHLDQMWRDWERWAADVSESHTSYPALIHTRSARPLRNWLIALLAVMDAAALSIVLRPHDRQVSARIMLRQGIECLRDLAVIEKIHFDPSPKHGDPILLTEQEFLDAVDMLINSGYEPHRAGEEAWPLFRDWRMMYEQIVYSLALKIDAVPALWSGPRRPATAQMPPPRPQYIVSASDGSIVFPADPTTALHLPPNKRLG